MSMQMEAEVEVNREDQGNINAFSKVHARIDVLDAQYEAKKKELDYLEDLAQEWELADEDDGPFKYRIGDTFVDLTLEESQERLAAATAAVQKELQAMKAQMDEAHAEVARLKKILYGKFGKSINLEM